MDRKLPLVFISKGDRVKIEDILGGENMRMRLREMGFLNGNFIKIIRNDVGPMILKVGESRIILGRGMASKILVSDR